MRLPKCTSAGPTKAFRAIANEIAQKIILDLRTDNIAEDIFDWQPIHNEIICDLEAIGLQAEFSGITDNSSIALSSSTKFFQDFLLRRASRLCHFLKKAAIAIDTFSKSIGIGPKALAIKFLDADSHNQGERPVMFQLAGKNYVLKFRDPRSYRILQHVLHRLQVALQIELRPPDIWYDSSNNWHVMPYLPANQRSLRTTEQNDFMSRLGILTAAAYFLQMTDIHLDNVLVKDGIPIIIDTECMFYGYTEYKADTIEDRLWSTGLVGESPALSGIRGGTAPIFEFLAKEEKGKVTYCRPTFGHQHNRLKDAQGKAVDPKDFNKTICEGFSKAYKFLCRSKEQLSAEIKEIALPDLRTRFLLRFTLHYATTIAMLRNPSTESDVIRLGKLASIFLKSRGMSDLINDDAKRCELYDMLGSDFPLFWVEDKENSPKLMHWSTEIRTLPKQDSLQNRIQRATFGCRVNHLPRLRASLRQFLLNDM